MIPGRTFVHDQLKATGKQRPCTYQGLKGSVWQNQRLSHINCSSQGGMLLRKILGYSVWCGILHRPVILRACAFMSVTIGP